MRKIQIIIFCVLCATTAFSQLATSPLFASGMVLQRENEILVWGISNPKDTVIVEMETIKDTAFADDNGKWQADLPAFDAGGPYQMIVVSGSETLTFSDVYIGDVYLASGQSNMEMTVSSANNASTNIAAANSQTIRQFKVAKSLGTTPAENLVSGTWTPATSSYVGNFSAAAYYFARDIQPYINDVPVGILNISYGGSRLETWMSDDMLGYDETDVVLASGEAERQPTLAYNNMIHPIVGIPLKGILWYQGESNADNMDDALVYGEQFKTLVTGWREKWGMGDVPFIWVQLPNQGAVDVENAPDPWDTWPQLRACQSRALSLPNTAEVVTIDIGDVDIHPKDKESLGARLALAARKLIYGEAVVADGPRYKSHTVLGNGSVQIEFDNVGTGLQATNTTSDSLHWFTCAGNDGVLRKADAVISGSGVIVSCDEVASIEMIRYAWEYNPVGVNFYNNENLPAAPFKITVPFDGFKIKTFTASETTIERGQSFYLGWETSGAVSTTINGIGKDSVSKAELWPMDTTSYVIVAVNRNDDTDILTQTLTVNVIDPLPTISISTAFGNVSPPNEEIILVADAKAPGGGTVVQVAFYIDDVLYETDTESPYETSWTPTDLGTYKITGIVTNGKGVTTTSLPYTMYINDLVRVRFEAENATLEGAYSKPADSDLSNGRYLQLQDAWKLTFTVAVPETGSYQVNIRYLLNYESPKEQTLTVNGVNKGNIRFEAPDIFTWMDYGLSLDLQQGNNEIVFTPSWGWMSFDYIDVLGALETPIESGISTTEYAALTLDLVKNKSDYMVTYTIPEDAKTKLDVYNVKGVFIKTLFEEQKTAGTHEIEFDSSGLEAGVYILKLWSNEAEVGKKIIIE